MCVCFKYTERSILTLRSLAWEGEGRGGGGFMPNEFVFEKKFHIGENYSTFTKLILRHL